MKKVQSADRKTPFALKYNSLASQKYLFYLFVFCPLLVFDGGAVVAEHDASVAS